jgi:hypothetical protein
MNDSSRERAQQSPCESLSQESVDAVRYEGGSESNEECHAKSLMEIVDGGAWSPDTGVSKLGQGLDVPAFDSFFDFLCHLFDPDMILLMVFAGPIYHS